jgi:hypothetical protein
MFMAYSIKQVYAKIGRRIQRFGQLTSIRRGRNLYFPNRRAFFHTAGNRCVTAKEIRVASAARFGQTRTVDPQMATQSGLRRLLIFLVLKGLDQDWTCKVSLI